MKITKSYLKQIIKEELENLNENPMVVANLQKQLDDKREEVKNKKQQFQTEIDNLNKQVRSLEAQLTAVKSSMQPPITGKIGA